MKRTDSKLEKLKADGAIKDYQYEGYADYGCSSYEVVTITLLTGTEITVMSKSLGSDADTCLSIL
jgi:hypothetical protein